MSQSRSYFGMASIDSLDSDDVELIGRSNKVPDPLTDDDQSSEIANRFKDVSIAHGDRNLFVTTGSGFVPFTSQLDRGVSAAAAVAPAGTHIRGLPPWIDGGNHQPSRATGRSAALSGGYCSVVAGWQQRLQAPGRRQRRWGGRQGGVGGLQRRWLHRCDGRRVYAPIRRPVALRFRRHLCPVRQGRRLCRVHGCLLDLLRRHQRLQDVRRAISQRRHPGIGRHQWRRIRRCHHGRADAHIAGHRCNPRGRAYVLFGHAGPVSVPPISI